MILCADKQTLLKSVPDEVLRSLTSCALQFQPSFDITGPNIWRILLAATAAAVPLNKIREYIPTLYKVLLNYKYIGYTVIDSLLFHHGHIMSVYITGARI